MISKIPKDKQLILFDGVCNLCHGSVLFVIKADETNQFVFASLDSIVGRELISEFHIDTKKTDSILLFQPKINKIYSKSSAALRIAMQLGFPINVLSIFIIIPTFLRNLVYDFIAKNRYRWFGKKASCTMPTTDLKAKFLE